jgi:hypothetical protein
MADSPAQFPLVPSQRDSAVLHQSRMRWAEKTGAGPDADLIDITSVVPTTIAALTSEPAPSRWPPLGRVRPVETTVWVLDATVVAFKLEHDGDYHLVLSDMHSADMIIEIPDPKSVDPSSRFRIQIASARAAFDARFGQQITALAALIQPAMPAPMIVHVAVPVRVTGVGFFDFIHGQAGVASNGVELHPVLSIEFET